MSAVPQPLPRAPGLVMPWLRATAALLLCWALLLLMYRQTAASMWQTWLRSDTYAHGLLVLPLALWLAWRRRRALAGLAPRAAPGWLLLVAVAAAVWLAGELAAVNALAQAALVAMLVLSVPAVLGPAVARAMAFALCFLFFAVPVGDFLLPQLMDWTAQVTTFALRASGIPVLRVGNRFVIPSGSWSVVEACSGVRYLMASFMLGTLFAYLNLRSWYKRLLFVLASLLVPLLANWMRAYLIVLLGHFSSNRLATGVDHVLYGWLFFGVVMAAMFALGTRWAEPQAPVQPGAQHPPRAADEGGAIWGTACALLLMAALAQLGWWELERQATERAARGTAPGTAPLAVAAPLLGPGWPLVESASGLGAASATDSTTSPSPAGVTAVAGSASTEMADLPVLLPAYQNATRVWQGHYGRPGHAVGLYIALYRHQVRGRTLVGSGNALLASGDPQWSRVAEGSSSLALGRSVVALRSSSLRASQALESSDAGTLQVWQLYWVQGHVTASDWLAKAFGAYARLRGQADDAAVVLTYAPNEADLAAFWRDNYAALQAWLSQLETP